MKSHEAGKARTQDQIENKLGKKNQALQASHNLLLPGLVILVIIFGWCLVFYGISTPLSESLASTGMQKQIHLSLVSMGVVTIVALSLLFVWDSKRRQRDRTEIERERLLLTEQEQRLLAETLGQAFLVLTTKTEQSELLDEILNQVQHVVPYDAANIVLLNNGVLHLMRWQGYQPISSENLSVELEQSIADFPIDAEVIQKNQPLVISDVWEEPRWIITSTSVWIRSFMAMPLCSQSDVIGLLRLDGSTPGQFSNRDLDRLKPLANAAVIALENARLYDQLRKELDERRQAEQAALELNRKLFTVQYAGAIIASSFDLHYILDTVTLEIVNLVKAGGCVISEWDKIDNRVSTIAQFGLTYSRTETSQSPTYSLNKFPSTKSVLVERRIHQITLSNPHDDTAELAYMQANRIKTLLMLPMEAQDDVIGLVEIIDSQTERHFSHDEISLIQLITNQAAIAIKNARLYTRIDKHLQAQIAIQLAITAISSTLDLTTVLGHIARQMGKAVDASSAYICSYEPETLTSTVLAEYFGPRASDEEKGSDLGATYPLPRDFSKNFALLLAGQLELIHVDDPSLNEFKRNCLRQWGVQTILNIPLMVKNQVIAFAELWESQQHREFTLEEVSLSHSIAQQAAVALENVRLYNQALQEIAERQKTEEALRKSEANLKAIFDSSQQAFILVDRDYKIQTFNRIAQQAIILILGQEMKEGDSIYDFVLEEEFASFDRCFHQAMAGEAASYERYLRIDQRDVWLEFNYNPVFTENDQVIGVCISTLNIDERKKMIETLIKSEDQLLAEIQSVLAITRALVTETNLNDLLEFMMVEAKYVTYADGVAVLLLGINGQPPQIATLDDTQQLDLKTLDASRLQTQPTLEFSLKGSLAELALVSRTIQVSNQTVNDSHAASIQAMLKPHQVNALVCAPLVVLGKSLGVLLIWSQQEQFFVESDLRTISLFADQAALALNNAHLYDLNRKLIIDQERQRMARELHDSVTQTLYSIGMAAEASLRLINQKNKAEIRKPIEHILTLSQVALKEIREHVHDLHSTTLTNNYLFETLHVYCVMLHEQYGLKIDLLFDPTVQLSVYQQENLYYIAKESLWNVVKHVGRTEVKVILTKEADQIIFSVADKGPGFVEADLTDMEMSGLRSMRERAKLLGGIFDLHVEIGVGTQIIVRLPNKLTGG